LPDGLPEADEALLNWVNGKQITPRQLWLIVAAKYLVLSATGIAKLAEHEGSVHILNTPIEDQPWPS